MVRVRVMGFPDAMFSLQSPNPHLNPHIGTKLTCNGDTEPVCVCVRVCVVCECYVVCGVCAVCVSVWCVCGVCECYVVCVWCVCVGTKLACNGDTEPGTRRAASTQTVCSTTVRVYGLGARVRVGV